MKEGSQDPESGILLIGIGNEYRSDDGVGLVVVRALRAKRLPNTMVIEGTGEGTALIEAWRDSGAAIIFDALSSGDLPGTIHRFDARAEPVPAIFFHGSTHAFGVAEAIELSRTLNLLPERLIIYGIEGKSFAAGTGLSPEVEKAVRDVVDLAIGEVANKVRENVI